MKVGSLLHDSKRSLVFLLSLWLVATGVGCATYVKNMPSSAANPPPAMRFAEYANFELEPVTIDPAYLNNDDNKRAFARIQENFDRFAVPVLDEWSAATGEATRGTLIIRPHVVELKFVSIGARVMVGAMAGSSAVVMQVDFEELTSGNTIARAQFYQRAAAMGGAYTMGYTDNDMLDRIVRLVSEYMRNNYSEATGGPTGVE